MFLKNNSPDSTAALTNIRPRCKFSFFWNICFGPDECRHPSPTLHNLGIPRSIYQVCSGTMSVCIFSYQRPMFPNLKFSFHRTCFPSPRVHSRLKLFISKIAAQTRRLVFIHKYIYIYICIYTYINMYVSLSLSFSLSIYVYWKTPKSNDTQMGQTTCKGPFDYHLISYTIRAIAFYIYIYREREREKLIYIYMGTPYCIGYSLLAIPNGVFFVFMRTPSLYSCPQRHRGLLCYLHLWPPEARNEKTSDRQHAIVRQYIGRVGRAI